MKLSNLYLGLAVAASSLVGISTLVSPVSAASVTTENGTFIFTGQWEFTFLYSYGSYKSNFGVDSKTLFSETSKATPGLVTPGTPQIYDFGTSPTSISKFFLATVNPSLGTIYSDKPSNPGGAFWILDGSNSLPTKLPSVDPKKGSPFAPSAAFAYFGSSAVNGTRIIGVNDSWRGDRDYNDFIVSAKAVPVPAIVPGIALAAAFFGSKVLKRNKKNASESVA